MAYGYRLDTAAETIEVTGVDVLVAGVRLDGLGGARRLLDRFDYATAHVGGLRYELADSLHVLRAAAARFDTRGARLRLDSVRLRPRLPGFDPDAESEPGPTVPAGVAWAVTFDADDVEVAGVDLRALLQQQALRARLLSLDTATVEVFRGAAASRTGGDGGGARAGQTVAIDSVDLAGVALAYRANGPRAHLEVPRAEFLLTDLALGEARAPGRERLFDFAEGRISLRDGLRYRPGADVEIGFAKADLDVVAGTASVTDLRYGPPLNAEGEPTGLLTVLADGVEATGVDYARLLWEGTLSTAEVDVAGLIVGAQTDVRGRTGERSPQDLLLVRLQRVPLPLEIDELAVTDADVRYRRRTDDSDETLRWGETDATFYHVGTSAAYAKTHPRAEVDIATRFEAMLPVDVRVTWPNAAGAPYELEAETGALDDLTRINHFLEPMAAIRVEGGRLERLAFSWTSDERRGRGRLQATYNGFRVNLLDESGDDKDVISLLANVAAVREESDGRSARVDVERPANQGMFGHWWAIIRDGLRQVALNDLGERVAPGD